MPMVFSDKLIGIRLDFLKLEKSGSNEEKRERLASYIETNYEDHVEVWEIRTGRPWSEMTQEEAFQLVSKHPELLGNPGVLSRMAGKS